MTRSDDRERARRDLVELELILERTVDDTGAEVTPPKCFVWLPPLEAARLETAGRAKRTLRN